MLYFISYTFKYCRWVHSVAFSPLCKESDRNSHMPLANVSSFSLVSAGNDGTVMVWKISSTSVSEETVRDLEVILRDVFAAQFDSNNEPIIAAVDMNNKVKVFDIKSGKVTNCYLTL